MAYVFDFRSGIEEDEAVLPKLGFAIQITDCP